MILNAPVRSVCEVLNALSAKLQHKSSRDQGKVNPGIIYVGCLRISCKRKREKEMVLKSCEAAEQWQWGVLHGRGEGRG